MNRFETLSYSMSWEKLFFSLSMVVFGLFGPILCVAVPMVAVAIAVIIYVVAHYCLSVPLSRHFQQEDGAAGMMMMMKKPSSEEAAEEMDNREGKYKPR